jgi:hypothetical protein
MATKIFPKSLLFVFLLAFSEILHAQQTWAIDADYAESCECNVPCPCILGKDPSHRKCTGNSIVMIKKGHYDTVNVDGLKMYLTFELEDWTKVYVDESATQPQIDALMKLLNQRPAVSFFFIGKVLSVEKVPVSVKNTDTTFTYSVPASYTQIQYLKGKDGQPVSLQNLRSNFATNNILAESVKLEHTGDDKAFSFSGTHGMVSHFSASGEIKQPK